MNTDYTIGQQDGSRNRHTGDFTLVSATVTECHGRRRRSFPTIRYTAFDALADVLDARCEAGVWSVPAHIAAAALKGGAA